MTNLCVCPSLKKSFTSVETPGPGLWRLYISIHNWWPRPRQTAQYTCNMDSFLVSNACPRLDLTVSHHCVWSENGKAGYVCEKGSVFAWASVCTVPCDGWSWARLAKPQRTGFYKIFLLRKDVSRFYWIVLVIITSNCSFFLMWVSACERAVLRIRKLGKRGKK